MMSVTARNLIEDLLTFYASRLAIKIKQNLLSESDGRLVAETEHDLRITEHFQDYY